jgi:hypothetical protein
LGIVTGVAGAGKSRLTRDYAAAQRDAGVRVIGTAVAGDAALTLGDEAQIETRNLAQLLCDLRPGPDGTAKDRLTKKTVVLVDEAGTLGAEQARAVRWRARRWREAAAARR